MFRDWDLQIKLTKDQINRRKGIQILFDVNILIFFYVHRRP